MTLRQAQGPRIVVITAGLRQPSSSRLLADRLAAMAGEQLADAEIEIVELREYARDLTNHLLTGFPSGHLSRLLDDVAGADALIAVSPIFSGSYSGLFKTFFDVLEPGTLAGKPVLIAATGGTARHSLVLDHALRPLFTLSAGRRRTDRGVCRAGGLGQRYATQRPRRPSGRRAGRADPAA